MKIICAICRHDHGRAWRVPPPNPGGYSAYCLETVEENAATPTKQKGVCGCEVSLRDALAAMQVQALVLLTAVLTMHDAISMTSEGTVHRAESLEESLGWRVP